MASSDEELEITSTRLSLCEKKILKIHSLAQIEYKVFFEKYMSKNEPLIVKNVTSGWKCADKWVRNSCIDYEHLTEQYGDLEVSITDCGRPECAPQKSTVRRYMEYLSGSDGRRAAGSCLYLKDWHLRRERPDDDFYRVPMIFASDWLNEYSIHKNIDDFMFVYIGPEGSWTQLHQDVYSSFSWSVNVTGRKRWVLVPPGEEAALRGARGELPRDLESWPGVRRVEVVQECGDAIFVPSGWHHVVYNQQDTISVNHNWVNGCNIAIIWENLSHALRLVENELDDIKNDGSFIDDCQRVLKCDHGLNYEEFIELLIFIGSKRIQQFDGDDKQVVGGYTLGQRHIEFDLRSILCVIDLVNADSRASLILPSEHKTQLVTLSESIKASSVFK